jgi:hypothetical protein
MLSGLTESGEGAARAPASDEQLLQPLRQMARRAYFGAARLPSLSVLLQAERGSLRPTIHVPKILDQGHISLVEGQIGPPRIT